MHHGLVDKLALLLGAAFQSLLELAVEEQLMYFVVPPVQMS
jgi:hypothetical protein